jgi:PKD domain
MRLFNQIGFSLSPHAGRRALTAVVLAVAAAAVFAFAAPPAGAEVTEIGGDVVGLQPRNEATVTDGFLQKGLAGGFLETANPESFANPAGDPVLHGTNVNVIYWDPGDPTTHTNYYHDDWVRVIDRFFTDLSAENGSLADVFAVDSQYTDRSNRPAVNDANFRASYEDDAPYPASECTDPRPLTVAKAHKIVPLGCVTDAQVQQELRSFIALHGLPTGLGEVYYLLTPPGLAVCLDKGGATGHCSDFSATKLEEEEHKLESVSYENSFCSYHSDINPDKVATGDGSTIVYAVVPWIAGGLGDGQLAGVDEAAYAYPCQDGGFDPSNGEKREKAKEVNNKEKEEFAEKDAEEKLPIEETREREAPHQQEPNQVPCPSEDGHCDTGLADLIIGQIATEQQNMVTDPLLNGWQDASGNEVTDECRNYLAPVLGGTVTAVPETDAGTLSDQKLNGDAYYVNSALNAAALHLNFPGVFCHLGVSLAPAFNTVSPVNAGETVGFNGMESDISLDAATGYAANGTPQTSYASYKWNFGDGTPEVSGEAPGAPACREPWLSPCAASVFHSYQYGGTYSVTLTVTDVGGHVATTAREVTVAGPTKPTPVPTAVTPQTTTPTTVSLSANGKVVGAPVAAAAILTRALSQAARKGISVRYSVNEQVAGHFEILLSRTQARHLGISGAPATGMAPGSAPQIVIAKALLITTKAGHRTVSIKLSKRTANHLRRTHKVALTLRLIVRNAAVTNPLTTTVVSSATLTG